MIVIWREFYNFTILVALLSVAQLSLSSGKCGSILDSDQGFRRLIPRMSIPVTGERRRGERG